MKNIPLYQVDAFAHQRFEGNPAAVCPLDDWLDDYLLQAIAEENNLSETAFIIPAGDGFALRWFTPSTEVGLCGHATLASAHVLFEHLDYRAPQIKFDTRSGRLAVEKTSSGLRMDFPAIPARPCATPEQLIQALGRTPIRVLANEDYIAVFENESVVRQLQPDFSLLSELDRRGVMVTAPGDQHDFVSRYFAPRIGIPEDPVTGAAHCTLAPYWANKLGKETLKARQVSRRGGEIGCQVQGDRIILSGQAVTYMIGEISI